jgi:hypothetical protein
MGALKIRLYCDMLSRTINNGKVFGAKLAGAWGVFMRIAKAPSTVLRKGMIQYIFGY